MKTLLAAYYEFAEEAKPYVTRVFQDVTRVFQPFGNGLTLALTASNFPPVFTRGVRPHASQRAWCEAAFPPRRSVCWRLSWDSWENSRLAADLRRSEESRAKVPESLLRATWRRRSQAAGGFPGLPSGSGCLSGFTTLISPVGALARFISARMAGETAISLCCA